MAKSNKTHKATAKRLIIKRSKSRGTSVLKRTDGQDHFNSRESGKTKRNKRRDRTMNASFQNTILKALPHL